MCETFISTTYSHCDAISDRGIRIKYSIKKRKIWENFIGYGSYHDIM